MLSQSIAMIFSMMGDVFRIKIPGVGVSFGVVFMIPIVVTVAFKIIGLLLGRVDLLGGRDVESAIGRLKGKGSGK